MVEMPRERRSGVRWRSLLGANIRYGLHASDMACWVRDSGPDGVRLALSDAVPLPETFDLHVHKTGQTRQVRLIWRGAGFVGVRYVPRTLTTEPIPIGLMRELREARAEIASLRARQFRQDDEG